jgi:hypothetical protein
MKRGGGVTLWKEVSWSGSSKAAESLYHKQLTYQLRYRFTSVQVLADLSAIEWLSLFTEIS